MPTPKEKLHGGPVERSMIWLRNQGYTVEKTEYRLSKWSPTTRDFLGFADGLAILPGEIGVLAWQATTADHIRERMRKVIAEPRHKTWLQCSNRIWVLGWKKGSGQPRVEKILLETAEQPDL